MGDSLAVYATNDPQLVDEIIRRSARPAMNKSRGRKGTDTLHEALLRDYSITQPTPKLLKAIAKRANAAPTLAYLLAPDRKQDLETYLWGMEMVDFLSDIPLPGCARRICWAAHEITAATLFGRLQLKAYPDQVHFIVDVIRYESHGRLRKGVCSSFLAERADDVPVPVFPSCGKTLSSAGKP